MAEEEEQIPGGASPAYDLQNGIFNLVIALVRNLESFTDPATAREHAAAYLDRLADGLRASTEHQQPSQGADT